MEVPQGKHAWMVKIGEKGQFVIPKEARDIFGFHPGDELLVLGRNVAKALDPAVRLSDDETEAFRLLPHTLIVGDNLLVGPCINVIRLCGRVFDEVEIDGVRAARFGNFERGHIAVFMLQFAGAETDKSTHFFCPFSTFFSF